MSRANKMMPVSYGKEKLYLQKKVTLHLNEKKNKWRQNKAHTFERTGKKIYTPNFSESFIFNRFREKHMTCESKCTIRNQPLN